MKPRALRFAPPNLGQLARRDGDDDDELWACDVAGV